jgi:hypothetical protein
MPAATADPLVRIARLRERDPVMNHNFGYRNRLAAMEHRYDLRASGATRRQPARGHPPGAGRRPPPQDFAALHARALTVILRLRSLDHLLLTVRDAGRARPVPAARRSLE